MQLTLDRRVTAVLGVLVTLVLAGALTAVLVLRPPSSLARQNPRGVSGRMTESDLTLTHPGGAILRVPAGALPPGTRVTLAPAAPASLSILGGLQPDGSAWSIDADTEPSSPVELTIPYDPAKLPARARPLVATYDELVGLWLPVPTTVDGRQLTAELPTFSFKTWISDRLEDASGPASWLEYQLWKLTGQRAARPDCAGHPKPDWVVDVVTNPDANAQLFACVEGTGQGFGISTANNRGYPVALEVDRPFSGATTGLPDDLFSLAAGLAAVTGNQRVLLMPTGTAHLNYDPVGTADGFVQGWVRRDTTALLMFLAVELAREAGADLPVPGGKKLGLWTLECFGKMFGAGGRVIEADVITAGNELRGCLDQTLTHEVRLWGFDPEEHNGDRLWSRDADRLPDGARNMVKALRVLRAISIAQWVQTAADLFVNDSTPETNLVDLGVRWQKAPVWGAGGEGGVYLYTLPAVSSAISQNTGRLTVGQLGGKLYAHSTSAWVGCDGAPATLTYHLDGAYRRLKATAGLAPHAPDGLTASVTLSTGGAPLATVEVSKEHTAPLDVDLSGVRDLVISVGLASGACEPSDTPYGILGDAYLIPGPVTTLDALPAAFVGSWSGQMIQPGSSYSPYSMKVTLHAGKLHAKVGGAEYSTLRCTEEWTLLRAEPSRLVVSETITRDPDSTCIKTGYLEVRPLSDGRMWFAFHRNSDLSDEAIAWATLS